MTCSIKSARCKERGAEFALDGPLMSSTLINRTSFPAVVLPAAFFSLTPSATGGACLASASCVSVSSSVMVDVRGRWTTRAAAAVLSSSAKRGITRDYTPFLLILQGMTLQLQGITLLPF